ncbi:MAG TPA: hypothetical protein VGM37_06125 [Armatimonadota bacterium]
MAQRAKRLGMATLAAAAVCASGWPAAGQTPAAEPGLSYRGPGTGLAGTASSVTAARTLSSGGAMAYQNSGSASVSAVSAVSRASETRSARRRKKRNAALIVVGVLAAAFVIYLFSPGGWRPA